MRTSNLNGKSPCLAVNTDLHPIIEAAAEGTLPDWATVSSARRAHMVRVSELVGAWADALDLSRSDRLRWRAVGYLHDALREVSPDQLRHEVPPRYRSLPGPLLHGPAVAERLRGLGVHDSELLAAVTYHTTGHESLGAMARALYAADFLEPGRTFSPEWRAGLRDRMPTELDHVTREIVAARISHVVDRGIDLLPDTVAFWNVLAAEG